MEPRLKFPDAEYNVLTVPLVDGVGENAGASTSRTPSSLDLPGLLQADA